MKKITLFPSLSSAGKDLIRQIEQLDIVQSFQFEVNYNPKTEDYIAACFCNSFIIIDATLEEENYQLYKNLNLFFTAFDHALIVSRTYLPLNFVPAIAGGAPPYPYPHPEFFNSSLYLNDPEYKWENEEILNWLNKKLAEISSSDLGFRMTSEELDSLLKNGFSEGSEAMNSYSNFLQGALNRRNQSLARGKIFISYRGKFYKDVIELAREIGKGVFHNGNQRDVKIFTPGELALEQELLSEGRRWMILGLLDDELRACDELWIYKTDDYLESWWTTGEIILANYIRDSGDLTGRKPPKIRVYDPTEKKVLNGDEYTVSFSQSQTTRIARFFTQSRTESASPRASQLMRVQRWFFRLMLGRIILFLIRTALNGAIGKIFFGMLSSISIKSSDQDLSLADGDMEAIQEILQYKNYKDYIFNRCFDSGFWNKLLFEKHYMFGDKYSSPKKEVYDIKNINDFIDAPANRMISLKDKQIHSILNSSEMKRTRVNKTMAHLNILKVAPRFLWKRPRNGGTIPGNIEVIPTYIIAAKED